MDGSNHIFNYNVNKRKQNGKIVMVVFWQGEGPCDAFVCLKITGVLVNEKNYKRFIKKIKKEREKEAGVDYGWGMVHVSMI